MLIFENRSAAYMLVWMPRITENQRVSPIIVEFGDRFLGFSLVESLVALALSLFLCMGIIHWWQSFSALNQDVLSTISLTEKERIATQLLQHAILPAGYFGCIHSSQQAQAISALSTLQLESLLAVKGFQANDHNWTPQLPNHLVNKILPHSDVLAVYHAAKQTAPIVQINHSQQELQIDSNSSTFKPGSWVIITNCRESSIAQITEVTSYKNRTMLDLVKPLSPQIMLPAEINLLDISYYYLAKATSDNKHSDTPALWVTYYQPNKTQIRWHSDELEPDISRFKLHFWQQTSKTQAIKLSPSAVTDWHAIVGAEINLQVKVMGFSHTTSKKQLELTQSWPIIVAIRQVMPA